MSIAMKEEDEENNDNKGERKKTNNSRSILKKNITENEIALGQTLSLIKDACFKHKMLIRNVAHFLN
jgi:hypothetical protein